MLPASMAAARFGFFWRVALPLSRPALATVAVLAIVGSWNAFLLPLLVLRTANQWTLPLGVMNFSDRYTADTALVLAFTTLSLVPALDLLRHRRAPDRGRPHGRGGQGMTKPEEEPHAR